MSCVNIHVELRHELTPLPICRSGSKTAAKTTAANRARSPPTSSSSSPTPPRSGPTRRDCFTPLLLVPLRLARTLLPRPWLKRRPRHTCSRLHRPRCGRPCRLLSALDRFLCRLLRGIIRPSRKRQSQIVWRGSAGRRLALTRPPRAMPLPARRALHQRRWQGPSLVM